MRVSSGFFSFRQVTPIWFCVTCTMVQLYLTTYWIWVLLHCANFCPHLRPDIYSPLTTCMLHPSPIPASHPLVDYFFLFLSIPHEVVFLFLSGIAAHRFESLLVIVYMFDYVCFLVPLFSLCLFFLPNSTVLTYTHRAASGARHFYRLPGPYIRSPSYSIMPFLSALSITIAELGEATVWHRLLNQTCSLSFPQVTEFGAVLMDDFDLQASSFRHESTNIDSMHRPYHLRIFPRGLVGLYPPLVLRHLLRFQIVRAHLYASAVVSSCSTPAENT